MRILIALFLAVFSTGLLVPAVAGDEPGSSVAKVYCVTFHKDGDAASATMEKGFMAKMRTEFASKNVLFVTADLTSAASRHQAQMLMNALSLSDVWDANASKPGTVVLSDPEYGSVKGSFTSTTKEADARAMLTKLLASDDDAGEDEGDG